MPTKQIKDFTSKAEMEETDIVLAQQTDDACRKLAGPALAKFCQKWYPALGYIYYNGPGVRQEGATSFVWYTVEAFDAAVDVGNDNLTLSYADNKITYIGEEDLLANIKVILSGSFEAAGGDWLVGVAKNDSIIDGFLAQFTPTESNEVITFDVPVVAEENDEFKLKVLYTTGSTNGFTPARANLCFEGLNAFKATV